jgi:hypothetical protein
MIQVNSLHYNSPSSKRSTRSHTLTPHDAVTLFCIVDGINETTTSIIEDHILESISSTEWNPRETSQDFSYITEHYNKFITSFPKEDLIEMRVLLGMLQGENLTLSTIWGTSGVFMESNGNLIDITVYENKSHEFHSITNWKIPVWSTIYLSNDRIERLLWVDILNELAQLTPEVWSETTTRIIEREIMNNLHIIRISRNTYSTTPSPISYREKRKQHDIIRDKWAIVIEYIRSKKMWEKSKWLIQKLPNLQNKQYLYTFLIIGIIILFILAYTLISSILLVFNTNTSDDKNLLIRAKTLIDEWQKLAGNPVAFNLKITEAEKILFDLRKEEIHIIDTQELLWRITSIKKDVYDIQEIDMTHLVSIIPFDYREISPLWVFEKDKKITLIGEKWAILNYVSGDKTLKIIPYPSNEIVKNFDVWEDGSIYILTTANNILSPERNDFKRQVVTGQTKWEDALNIKTFNWNIYLLESTKNQVQRHKPWVNGFSQKSSLLKKDQAWIFDLSIDGWIYLYMEDGKIFRYFSDKDTLNPITLNKIPWEWNINTALSSTFITRSYLSYIYILNWNKIWIFQPNSKRFQDITSWEYKGQFELKSEEEVKSINVPRDGIIYVTTNRWVYDLKFEFIDGKVIFK